MTWYHDLHQLIPCKPWALTLMHVMLHEAVFLLLTSQCTQHVYHQHHDQQLRKSNVLLPFASSQTSARLMCWQGAPATGCQICCCAVCAFPGVHHWPEVAQDSQQSFGSQEAMPCCSASIRPACYSCYTYVKSHWTLLCTVSSMEIDDVVGVTCKES